MTEAALIPRPAQLEETGARYELTAETAVNAGARVRQVAELVHEDLSRATGLPLALGAGAGGIALSIDEALSPEHYRLDVTADGVRIAGGDQAGVFYGYQTLKQLLPVAVFGGERPQRWEVPGVRITDGPAFGWRGSMLDVGRHFMPKEFVLRYIDLLAMHKLNVLHLHLSEDQGWRVEIKRYPRLTEVGAWRSETLVGKPNRDHPEQNTYDGVRHGGFYTQDDIREIVEYAARRFITVVPEIDLPGHIQSAIAAYPELGNTGEQLEVLRGWGINPHVLNVEDSTVEFFCNVFTELFDLFPSAFIHVGGDEVPKDEWRAAPRAQERMRELGLQDEEQLQSWFISQLDTFLTKSGRRLIGWDEILEGGLAPGATVMSWRGEEGGIRAAKAGHDVVMAPTSYTYFDYYQAEDQENEPLAIGSFLPLERVYEYSPIPAELAGDGSERVLGSQFQLWTEYMPDSRQVEYMAFPRACAFSEVVWSPQRDTFAAFRERLEAHLARLQALAVNYRPL